MPERQRVIEPPFETERMEVPPWGAGGLLRSLAIGLGLAIITAVGGVLWSALVSVSQLQGDAQRMSARLNDLALEAAASTAKDVESTNDRAALHALVLHQTQVSDQIHAEVDAAKALAIGTKTESETQFKMVGQAVNTNSDDEHQRFCSLYVVVRKGEPCPYKPQFFPQLFDDNIPK